MTRAARRWIAAACLPAALVGCVPTAAAPSRPDHHSAADAPSRASAPARVEPKPGTLTAISLAALFPLQQSNAALIYDVRPGFSFHFGHIPGASSWPKSQFDAQLAQREAEIRAATAAKRPVILYCTDLSCPDSTKVATRLATLGHSVAILEGGYAAWKSAELPCE